MKTASISEVKKELKFRSSEEIENICLRLARFKKENKELLTYLLFEASDEEAFRESIKNYIDARFEEINHSSFYYIKKSSRKILRETKKYIRYSQNKETEVELLIHYCRALRREIPKFHQNKVLVNLWERQIVLVKKKLATLHEDLQHDLQVELQELV